MNEPVPAAAYGTQTVTTLAPKCWRCGRRLAEYLSEPWSMRCQRCHAENRKGAAPGR